MIYKNQYFGMNHAISKSIILFVYIKLNCITSFQIYTKEFEKKIKKSRTSGFKVRTQFWLDLIWFVGELSKIEVDFSKWQIRNENIK